MVKAVDVRIENKESVNIPKCAEEFSLIFNNRFIVETVRKLRCAVGVEVPANGVGPKFIESVKWVNGVAL